MSEPTSEEVTSALWRRLLETSRASKVIDFPRKHGDGAVVGQIRLVLLSQQEQMACTAAAEQLTRQHLREATAGDLGYDDLFSNAVCDEILYRACRDPENPTRSTFPSVRHLRSELTRAECLQLFQLYVDACDELGPQQATSSESEPAAEMVGTT